MSEVLTLERAEELVTQIAEAEPDRLAECYYTVGGEPHCIVGRVLDAHGLDLERLVLREMDEWQPSVSIASVYLLPEFGLNSEHITEEAVSYLEHVQREQDSGLTWSKAAEAGRRQYARYPNRPLERAARLASA